MTTLSKKDRQRIIEILESEEELPLDYKHILFPPERKEYELVYAGKEREEDILADTMAVPLQPIKTFRKNGNGWTNKLIFGDNLQAMKSLLDDPEVKGRVKLIYIDPPFATRQEFRGSQDQKAYQDKIAGSQFVEFLRKRLIFLRELLFDDGTLVVHLDWRKNHYIKVILDEVFGENNFTNNIVVSRGRRKNLQTQFDRISSLGTEHDVLLLYKKSSLTQFNIPLSKIRASKEQWQSFWRGNFERPTMQYELLGWKPDRGQFLWSKERAYKAVENYKKFEESGVKNLLEYWKQNGGSLEFISWIHNHKYPEYWIPPKTEGIIGDVWLDIQGYSYSNSYPTEKHEELLKRVIEIGSNYGDIVIDAFAGSGTTLAVAEKLGRRWIGIDCGKLAIYTIQKRMLNLKTEIGNKGKPLKPKSFTLYHAGLYDFPKLKKLPWKDWRVFALHLFNCRDNKHTVSGIELDGYKGRSDVMVFNYQQEGGVVLDYGFIDDLHSMIGSKVGKQFFIIAPAASVVFLEDYIDKGSVRYYILRIPYSIINELHNRDFEAIKQPIDESQVNDTVDAVGFDFIRPPKVKCEYLSRHPKDKLQEIAVIKIKTFKSEAMIKGASQLGNLESLSMVMVDFDYDEEVFNLDEVFYASEIEKNGWEVHLPVESIKNQIMVMYLDIYGNEYREIKTMDCFKSIKGES